MCLFNFFSKYVKRNTHFLIYMTKVIYDKEMCKTEALKYQSRFQFKKFSITEYNLSRNNGWLDEICSHMLDKKQLMTKWTKEKCKEEAIKYKTKKEFEKNSKSGYNASWKNGWLDELCFHMKKRGVI